MMMLMWAVVDDLIVVPYISYTYTSADGVVVVVVILAIAVSVVIVVLDSDVFDVGC